MSIIFGEEKKQLKVNFTSEIKAVICFKDFNVFLYFKSGHYHVWNLFKNELLISKPIENDIIKFAILNDTTIVYIRLDGTLKAHNVFTNNEGDLFSTTLPTTLGAQYNNLNLDFEIFKQNIITQCLLFVNQENRLIYLIERATYSSIKIHHIVSVFHLTSSWQPLYQYPLEHEFPLQFSYLNKSSTFILWDQFFLEPVKSTPAKKKNKPSFFYLGEFKNDRLDITRIDIMNNINIDNSSNSTIIGIAEADSPSRLLIFENTNTKPTIKVFDLEEKLILKQISCELGPDMYCITDIFMVIPTVNQNKTMAFFEIESYQTSIRVCDFDQSSENISNLSMLKRTEDSFFEFERNNGKYCVEVEKSCFIEESPFKDMTVHVKFFRPIKSKLISLYYLHKLNVYHIYINKMVIDFLPS